MSTLTEVRERPQGTHVRVHGSVLAEAEKRLLVWLAHRLPRHLNADHLTAIGAFGTLAAGAAFAAAAWDPRALWLVPVMLTVNWFGDSLDGTVARVRGHQRPRYGYYLDHAVDLVNATALFTGMAVSGLMNPLLGLGLLIGYILLCAESFLATHAVGVFRISFSGVGPTELRILLSIGAVTAIFRPVVTPFGLGPVALFDLSAVISIVGMAVAFGVSTSRNARTLYLAEPLPSAPKADTQARDGR
jgi:archaetidylinositol phosphate synthase